MLDSVLGELIGCIDWKPFFEAWDLHGRFPEILDDPKVGEAARPLYDDALEMLEEIKAGGWLKPSAVVGFWPATTVGDDINISHEGVSTTLHTLRQQIAHSREGRANLALADFITPAETDITDYIGSFVVTAGPEIERHAVEYEKAHDDYRAILLKALGDRIVEAFAERMHERVRKEFWGYAPSEDLPNKALIAEEYRGIRPAPGYPACPDHTEKRALFALLDAEAEIGVKLTENCAMWPASSVSGTYFSHPEARYFGVGRIDRDQVEDYARRKGMTIVEVERWLAPNLAYDPNLSTDAAA